MNWPWTTKAIAAATALRHLREAEAREAEREKRERGPVEYQVILLSHCVPERRRVVWVARVDEEWEVGIERDRDMAHEKGQESLRRRYTGTIVFERGDDDGP